MNILFRIYCHLQHAILIWSYAEERVEYFLYYFRGKKVCGIMPLGYKYVNQSTINFVYLLYLNIIFTLPEQQIQGLDIITRSFKDFAFHLLHG